MLRQWRLSISEYALAHQTLWDQVDYYLPTDDPKCRSYQNTLLTRLLRFLYGLSREYDDIRRRALHYKEGMPKLADLVKELKEEESHFLLHGIPATEMPWDSSALLISTTTTDLLDQIPSTSTASSFADIVCSHCRRGGHTRGRCYKLHPELAWKKKVPPKAMLTQSNPFVPIASSSVSTME